MLHRRRPRHAPLAAGLDTRNVRAGLIASITALVTSGAALAASSRGRELLALADFYLGVLALVTLTATVALGLLATERVFLAAPYRVRVQLAHRYAALAGMLFLAGHVVLRSDRAPWLGVLAAVLLAVAALSGVGRGRFAGTARPWAWRVVHGAAYLAWPLSVLHSLTAGRAPAGWVTWAYFTCLAAVGAALLVRVWAAAVRPPAVPERVQAETPAAAEPDLVQPVDLARYRKAG